MNLRNEIDPNSSNYKYLMKLKNSIIDPLGKNIVEDLNWLQFENKWGLSKFESQKISI